MAKIELRLSVRTTIGSNYKTFSKTIESEHTPSKEMVFSGEDYTLEDPRIYFDLDDGNIVVWFNEHPAVDEMDGWDFLVNEGWTQE